MRTNIINIVMSLLILVGISSCGEDNYAEPKETFTGRFIDKGTKKPFQTALGDYGIRIRMMEYSWSDNPQPYDFNCKMDGTFNNTKIFKGEYGVIPSGAFVPLAEERITISGTVEKTFEVEPILRVEWVGEPVLKSDTTVEFQVKITYGTENATYKQPLFEGWLFVNENNYVFDSGDDVSSGYSRNYSVDCTPAQMGETNILGANGTTFTVSTKRAKKRFPDYSRKYFFRFAARTDLKVDGIKRYNYTEVKEITIPAK